MPKLLYHDTVTETQKLPPDYQHAARLWEALAAIQGFPVDNLSRKRYNKTMETTWLSWKAKPPERWNRSRGF